MNIFGQIRTTAPGPKKKRGAGVKLRASTGRAIARPEEEEEEYEDSEPNMKLSHAFVVVLVLHLVAIGGVYGFNRYKNRDVMEGKTNAEAVAGKVEESKGAGGVKKDAVAAKAADPNKHEVAAGDTLNKIAGRYGVSVEQIEKANGLTASSVLRSGQKLTIPQVEAKPVVVPQTKVAPKPAVAQTKATPKVVEPQSKVAVKPEVKPVADAKPVAEVKPKAETKVAETKAVPAKASGGEAAGGEQEYVVVAGDNPYSVAKKFHVSYQKLVEVNGIDDPTKIRIGQKLKIPSKQ